MPERTLSGGDRGYFCISEKGPGGSRPILQGEVDGDRREIWIGADDPVTFTVEKMFGPLIFWSVRVTPDFESCEWIIEREFGPGSEWREVARVPGQLESDFTDD